jgi:nitroreductase
MEKTVSEAITYRRSVRVYTQDEIDSEKVRNCLRNASIAPTSSNLQLWEFHHVSSTDLKAALSSACFDQSTSKTAQQFVVFVSRKDLWRKRAKANLEFLHKGFSKGALDEKMAKRKKMATTYYSKVIPMAYIEFFGLFGVLKYLACQIIGLFRPIYRQTRLSDMRIVAHKSTALAAQNFMISMAAIGYDTCPMEGFDSRRVKQIMNLPKSAEITMIVSCGVRDEKGVYGPQFRIPFEEIYFAS